MIKKIKFIDLREEPKLRILSCTCNKTDLGRLRKGLADKVLVCIVAEKTPTRSKNKVGNVLIATFPNTVH